MYPGSAYLQNIVWGAVGHNRIKPEGHREGGIQLSMPIYTWFRVMDYKWRTGLIKKMIGLVLNMLDLGSSWDN